MTTELVNDDEIYRVIFWRSPGWIVTLLGLQRKRAAENRGMVVREREAALDNILILKGILPIYAWYKKIRNDKGYWMQIESYIADHSEADFTHGIFPACMDMLYSELKVSNHRGPATEA